MTFYANADQSKYWGDGTMNKNHLDRLLWYLTLLRRMDLTLTTLRYNGQEARLLLETSTDGYFNNDMLMKQVDKAIQTFV